MQLAEVTEKYKNRIINMAIIIVAIIISINIYQRQAAGIKALEIKKDTEKKKDEVLGSISRLLKKVNYYKEFLMPRDSNFVINTLSDIARESGVEIKSIRPDLEKRYVEYIEYPFALTVSADDYHALGKFISMIESYQDIYIVEEIAIGPGIAAQEKQARGLVMQLRVKKIVLAQ